MCTLTYIYTALSQIKQSVFLSYLFLTYLKLSNPSAQRPTQHQHDSDDHEGVISAHEPPSIKQAL